MKSQTITVSIFKSYTRNHTYLVNLRRKYVGIKEENDKLRNLLIEAKKDGEVPPVMLANHARPISAPKPYDPAAAKNMIRMEQVIQDMGL